MRYPYVFFDWDGTLIKTVDAWVAAKQQTFADFGFDLTRHEVGETIGDLTSHETVYGIDDKEFHDVLLPRVAKLLENVDFYDGAATMLQDLHNAGSKLALLTTSTRKIINDDLERIGVVHLFDIIVTADITTNHKPHPEVIERAMEHFGAKPEQVLMVGDSSKDLGAAKAAGVDAALFHHPDLHGDFYDIDYLTKEFNPTYVIESIGELPSIVTGKTT